VICSRCGEQKKELKKKLRGASPRQIEILKTAANAELIAAIQRETKWQEQGAPEEPEKDEHGCIIGVEKWNQDLHQCIRIEKHPPTQEQVVVPYQPAPEIPAQPVIPVGPITVEQKIAAIEDELAKMRLDIANILGMLGQRG